MACSALKASYRQRLAADLPALAFVHLQAPRAVLENRLANRRGHFFPATLLDSQLATLEPLSAAEGFAVDATLEVEPLVAAIRLGLHNRAR